MIRDPEIAPIMRNIPSSDAMFSSGSRIPAGFP